MKQTDDFPAARPRRSHLLLVLFVLAAGSTACSLMVNTPDRESPGFAVDSIRQEDMRADLFFLASDAMNGRAATSRDVAITSEFIKARFQRLGLIPGGPENSYFQAFNLVSAALGDGDNSLVIDGIDTGGLRRRSIGEDYYTLNFSASGSGSGELAYAGFGIVEPRLVREALGRGGDPPRRQGVHDRGLAAELVERRGETDARFGRQIAHRKFRLAVAQQAFGRVDHTIAHRFTTRTGRGGLDGRHIAIYIMI